MQWDFFKLSIVIGLYSISLKPLVHFCSSTQWSHCGDPSLCCSINWINSCSIFSEVIRKLQDRKMTLVPLQFPWFSKTFWRLTAPETEKPQQRLSRYYLWSKFFSTFNTNIALQGKALFMFFIPQNYAATNEAYNIFWTCELRS